MAVGPRAEGKPGYTAASGPSLGTEGPTASAVGAHTPQGTQQAAVRVCH